MMPMNFKRDETLIYTSKVGLPSLILSQMRKSFISHKEVLHTNLIYTHASKHNTHQECPNLMFLGFAIVYDIEGCNMHHTTPKF
mmetsp:Transcript_21231/g.24434  ORF Transcript_21231/g.24434 Transcript_21231/m.24434 type:complete len:84 (-) Transcript_21231:87-338(-)